MSKVINLNAYHEDQLRVNSLIGFICTPIPATPENISRNRLLRVQAGLRHLLIDVIPRITDEQHRHEVYLWVDGIYSITCVEEVDAGEGAVMISNVKFNELENRVDLLVISDMRLQVMKSSHLEDLHKDLGVVSSNKVRH